MLSDRSDGVTSTHDIADVLEAELKAKGPDVSAETIEKIHKVLSQYGITVSLPLSNSNAADDTVLSDLTSSTEVIEPSSSDMIYVEDFARMTSPLRLRENTVIALESRSPDLSAARLLQQPCFLSHSQYASSEQASTILLLQPPLTTLLQQGPTVLPVSYFCIVVYSCVFRDLTIPNHYTTSISAAGVN